MYSEWGRLFVRQYQIFVCQPAEEIRGNAKRGKVRFRDWRILVRESKKRTLTNFFARGHQFSLVESEKAAWRCTDRGFIPVRRRLVFIC